MGFTGFLPVNRSQPLSPWLSAVANLELRPLGDGDPGQGGANERTMSPEHAAGNRRNPARRYHSTGKESMNARVRATGTAGVSRKAMRCPISAFLLVTRNRGESLPFPVSLDAGNRAGLQ